MSAKILATGLGGAQFKTALHNGFKEAKPEALGIAVAYVSVSGFQYVQKLINKYGIKHAFGL
jgi:hypothetical protein